MKEHTLYKIEEMLCSEIDEIAEKEHIGSMSDLQTLDTALHSMKNLYKIMDGMDDSSYRSGESYYSRRGGSYRDGSYRYSRDGGSYADGGAYRGYSRDEGGSYRRKRDSMGRFSRSGGDMIDRLKNMADETDDPQERKDLHEFISGLEHRA